MGKHKKTKREKLNQSSVSFVIVLHSTLIPLETDPPKLIAT